MVSWKSSVSCTEKREEHMLSFTLETRSLICDAAIIRPSQYGQSVIRCNINKRDASRFGWTGRLQCFFWFFSGGDELWRSDKGLPCLSAAPKTKKRWPNFRKKNSKLEADLVSVNQGGVPEKASSDILWQLTHTERFLFVFLWAWNSHPFSQVNRLVSLCNGHIETLDVVPVNVSSGRCSSAPFPAIRGGFLFQRLDNCSSKRSNHGLNSIFLSCHMSEEVF